MFYENFVKDFETGGNRNNALKLTYSPTHRKIIVFLATAAYDETTLTRTGWCETRPTCPAFTITKQTFHTPTTLKISSSCLKSIMIIFLLFS